MAATRREFLAGSAAALLAGGTRASGSPAAGDAPPARVGPVIVGSVNALGAMDAAHALLRGGADGLDAVLSVCRAVEDDPSDDSVGYGGLPNEDGEVELDACCMHGPTRRAGAVAGVRGIRHVADLARVVMERTDHLLLVAEGARRFAVAHGFPEENLLTERSRQLWLLWREWRSGRDSWGPGLTDPSWAPPAPAPGARLRQREELGRLAARTGVEPRWRDLAVDRLLERPTGTVHVCALDKRGGLSGATSTSGLAWKIPGRVGDSPLIGAGCWTDPDVGSAGATGRGEENIKICGAHTIVENMRRGMSPADAALDALRRIARNYDGNMDRLKYVGMTFYVLRRDGAYAGASLWSGPPEKPRQFAVHDGNKRLERCVSLFEGSSIGWPPMPPRP
ncbi:MAG: N(4)-(beta-N-acetylglucosaminyl)-L-asparaginase [Acidobacteria bacterium]|nr:N(4)-(beta-N-acetylglucosaminyl)-L-asparaginase [Acidobacteriota bacterium]